MLIVDRLFGSTGEGGRVMPGTGTQLDVPTRKISQCMQGWLSSHYLGFDWSRPTISSDEPWRGMAASTNGNLMIFVGSGRYRNFETADTRLFFHEITHMPQWQSRQMTTPSYAGSAIAHGFNHDAIPYEIDAESVGRFLDSVYNDEGRPCDNH